MIIVDWINITINTSDYIIFSILQYSVLTSIFDRRQFLFFQFEVALLWPIFEIFGQHKPSGLDHFDATTGGLFVMGLCRKLFKLVLLLDKLSPRTLFIYNITGRVEQQRAKVDNQLLTLRQHHFILELQRQLGTSNII